MALFALAAPQVFQFQPNAVDKVAAVQHFMQI
jgi:hypothetical protein